MISAIVSRLVIIVFGTLYPAYASYKAVRTKNIKEYVKWMMYWIVFALFICAETFTDVFLSFWFPFYYEIKIILVLWLLSPATKGSSILYRKFVHPMLSQREQEIDEYIAKAKQQGYHTVLHLGTQGVNFATNVIMQTAIKFSNVGWKTLFRGLTYTITSASSKWGGGGLVNQIRRSYSLSDLSGDDCGIAEVHQMTAGQDQQDGHQIERRKVRPRSGYSPRRSASGSGRVDMYFPEVDVDVRQTTQAQRDVSASFSHIRSSEDVSSGYSSAEPLYGSKGPIGAGSVVGTGMNTGLVRTGSVGGCTTRAGRKLTRSGSSAASAAAANTGGPSTRSAAIAAAAAAAQLQPSGGAPPEELIPYIVEEMEDENLDLNEGKEIVYYSIEEMERDLDINQDNTKLHPQQIQDEEFQDVKEEEDDEVFEEAYLDIPSKKDIFLTPTNSTEEELLAKKKLQFLNEEIKNNQSSENLSNLNPDTFPPLNDPPLSEKTQNEASCLPTPDDEHNKFYPQIPLSNEHIAQDHSDTTINDIPKNEIQPPGLNLDSDLTIKQISETKLEDIKEKIKYDIKENFEENIIKFEQNINEEIKKEENDLKEIIPNIKEEIQNNKNVHNEEILKDENINNDKTEQSLTDIKVGIEKTIKEDSINDNILINKEEELSFDPNMTENANYLITKEKHTSNVTNESSSFFQDIFTKLPLSFIMGQSKSIDEPKENQVNEDHNEIKETMVPNIPATSNEDIKLEKHELSNQPMEISNKAEVLLSDNNKICIKEDDKTSLECEKIEDTKRIIDLPASIAKINERAGRYHKLPAPTPPEEPPQKKDKKEVTFKEIVEEIKNNDNEDEEDELNPSESETEKDERCSSATSSRAGSVSPCIFHRESEDESGTATAVTARLVLQPGRVRNRPDKSPLFVRESTKRKVKKRSHKSPMRVSRLLQRQTWSTLIPFWGGSGVSTQQQQQDAETSSISSVEEQQIQQRERAQNRPSRMRLRLRELSKSPTRRLGHKIMELD